MIPSRIQTQPLAKPWRIMQTIPPWYHDDAQNESRLPRGEHRGADSQEQAAWLTERPAVV
jgi:hypothetical protein